MPLTPSRVTLAKLLAATAAEYFAAVPDGTPETRMQKDAMGREVERMLARFGAVLRRPKDHAKQRTPSHARQKEAQTPIH